MTRSAKGSLLSSAGCFSASPSLNHLVFSTSGRVVKWLSRKELWQMGSGLVPGVTQLDVISASEGQADALMRGYSKRLHWWELEDWK